MIAYDHVLNKIRNTLNSIFGESWSLSCPVPDVINGIPVDKHFLYAISMGNSQRRPFALVISAMDTGTILIMKHCAAEDFVDTSKHPFDVPINNTLPKEMGVKEYKESMRQLRNVYDTLRQIVFTNGMPIGKEKMVFDRYKALLEELTPVAHGPYYDAMMGKEKA